MERKDKIQNECLKLTTKEKISLKEKTIQLKNKIEKYEEELLKTQRILDYDNLKEKGFSDSKINEFIKEDDEIVLEAKANLKNQIEIDKNYMFGYPANMNEESGVVSYLRWIESQLCYMNSCGTPYSLGNYRMANRKNELEIISKILKNLGLKEYNYWGYITTGGTESNLWGIREGISKFPNAKIYFSEDTHYSGIKGAAMMQEKQYEVIPTIKGEIDKKILLEKILKDKKAKENGVILLLNFGTTALGSIDDISWITENINKNNIPKYIHLDSALYGGIPNNQKDSPMEEFEKINKADIDSISISLHKYLGIPKTNGVLIAKTQINDRYIEYIGQKDVTLCGSRDFLPYTTLQKLKENYDRNENNDYSKNNKIFENLLIKNNIIYEKGNKNGNIFIIEKPSEKICKKYQLATFTYKGKKMAHIIIFPYHNIDIMKELINDIKVNK